MVKGPEIWRIINQSQHMFHNERGEIGKKGYNYCRLLRKSMLEWFLVGPNWSENCCLI